MGITHNADLISQKSYKSFKSHKTHKSVKDVNHQRIIEDSANLGEVQMTGLARQHSRGTKKRMIANI